MSSTTVALSDLIAALGGDLLGGSDIRIAAIAPLDEADEHGISFLANPRYQAQLGTTRAACVIVAPALAEAAANRGGSGGAAIVTPDPYLYFARLTQWWAARTRPQAVAGVHPSAIVSPAARLGQGVEIGPLAVVEADAVIGDGARIGAHCVVERDAAVGEGTRLAPRVVLGHGCSIGARGIVHSGVVIGADGFGFAPSKSGYVKIEQLGNVRIGDDVEIGANTCIDRGALADTVIEDGVKLDNLIQVARFGALAMVRKGKAQCFLVVVTRQWGRSPSSTGIGYSHPRSTSAAYPPWPGQPWGNPAGIHRTGCSVLHRHEIGS